MSNSYQEAIMDHIRERFRKQFGTSSASVLLDRVRLVGYADGVIRLEVDSEFTYNILRERYSRTLEEMFSDILGFEARLELVNTGEPVDPERFIRQMSRDAYGHTEEEKYEQQRAALTHSKDEREVSVQDAADAERLEDYNFEYTFDNFIVGSSNKFAHAACIAVVDKPAMNYNPLFIHGPSGIGKTHLLRATMNGLRQKNPRTRMLYVKAEDFTNEMIDCISRQAMKEFRDKYRSCDVLLIDDIQFIAGKVATQEEFFHTFNALFEEKKQIILTSDRPPCEIQRLEERLQSRFEWGLMADIQPPDLELRMAIIKKKAEQVNLEISDEILVYLAENLRSNVRQLEGAIKKLGAFRFLGQSVTMELARGCINELLGGAEPQSVTLGKIFSAVNRRLGVTKEDLTGKKRAKDIAYARHVAIFLVRDITEMSLPNIGKLFDRDHSTVKSSLDIIDRKLRTDRAFKELYDDLRKQIVGG